MIKPDILILGVGRSGTSFVAEVLHRRFGVCFGHDASMLKDFRGETVYEDAGLKKMIKRVVKGEVGIDSWLRKFDATHRGCTAKLTGAKLLDFGALSFEQFMAIGPKAVIRTIRPYRSNVESWCRYRAGGIGTDEDRLRWAEDYVEEREGQITRLVPQLKHAGIIVSELFFWPERYRWSVLELAAELESCLLLAGLIARRPDAGT